MSGWIKLHRKVCENEIWLKEPFSRGQAWVDLLLLASHKDTHFWKRGVLVEQGRGQVGISVKGLGARWKWSRNKVKKFIKDLEKVHQIEHQTNNVTTLITLTNYSQYQEKGTPERTPSDTPNDTPKGTPEGHNQEVKKKEEKKTTKGTKFNSIKFRPDFINENDWKDIVDHRRKQKASNSERAYSSLVKELKVAVGNGFTVSECIDEMVNRSWRGFKAEWMPEKKQAARGRTCGSCVSFLSCSKDHGKKEDTKALGCYCM